MAASGKHKSGTKREREEQETGHEETKKSTNFQHVAWRVARRVARRVENDRHSIVFLVFRRAALRVARRMENYRRSIVFLVSVALTAAECAKRSK